MIIRRALLDLRAEFTGRAIDGFYLCRRMCALEQHDDFVQGKFEIGGSGDGDFSSACAVCPTTNRQTKNQHPHYKPANCAHLDLDIREVVDIFY